MVTLVNFIYAFWNKFSNKKLWCLKNKFTFCFSVSRSTSQVVTVIPFFKRSFVQSKLSNQKEQIIWYWSWNPPTFPFNKSISCWTSPISTTWIRFSTTLKIIMRALVEAVNHSLLLALICLDNHDKYAALSSIYNFNK